MPNRRHVLAMATSLALAAGTTRAQSADPLLTHRFGVDYVPSHNWYFCWNDWNAGAIARDFDAIAGLGADHMRIMLIWPYFQPNPALVSAVHLDRLDELMRLAADRHLDVLVTLYTGWLSGFKFTPPFYGVEPFYTSDRWRAAQFVYLDAVAGRMKVHGNFMGFDVGNEINDCWACTTDVGDPWMADILGRMNAALPGAIHVNGVDNQPWFREDSFSPQALVAAQKIVPLHCWPYWTGAGDRGGPLDKPYTHLPAAMAALARSYGAAPQKPIWIQEFGVCDIEMPAKAIPIWMETAITAAVAEGVSWFTWWSSHDVDRRFEFHPFEYELGLLTVDNKVKPRGETFRRLASAYRGKPVVMPKRDILPPPQVRTIDATWAWLLAWMAA